MKDLELISVPNKYLYGFDGSKYGTIKNIKELCSYLESCPFLSSKVSGRWTHIGTRTLTENQARLEVGWLYKYTTEDQRKPLEGLLGKDLRVDMWEQPSWQEHVRKSLIKAGKLRVSRMRSSYKPVNELFT